MKDPQPRKRLCTQNITSNPGVPGLSLSAGGLVGVQRERDAGVLVQEW